MRGAGSGEISTPAAIHWNVFRGPACGVSPWTNAPAAWDGASGRGVLWQTPLRMTGVSSPVLWGKRLYITEGDEKERAVLAFDAGNGRLLWRRLVADGGQGTPLPAVSDYGLAMPTPACDSNGVYALFGTGDLAAFSPDGKLMWRLFLGRPTIGYGFASSPVVVSNLVVVQFDHHAAGRVLALETTTGKIMYIDFGMVGQPVASAAPAPRRQFQEERNQDIWREAREKEREKLRAAGLPVPWEEGDRV